MQPEARPAEGLWPRVSWMATAMAASVVLWVHAAHFRANWLDDAYISFRYAENWWAGRGMVFNEGERLEGLTNLAWAMVMAPFTGADPLPLAQDIGFGCAVLGVWLVAWWARRFDVVVQALAVAPLVVLPWLPFWSVQGMETPAVMLLLTYGWVRATHERELLGRGARPWPMAALALGLAPAFRPDAAAMVGVVALWWLLGPQRRSRHTVVSACILMACAVALVALKLAWFGEILPNTFHVKVGAWPFPNGQQYVLSFLQVPWTPASFALLGAMLWGLFGAAGRLPAALALTMLGVCFVTNGDFFASFRFLVPVLPAFGACLAVAGQQLFDAFTQARHARAWLAAAGLVAFVPTLGVAEVHWLGHIDRFPWSSARVSQKMAPLLSPHWFSETHVYRETWAFPAAWVLVHANPHEVVAFTDIGLFSWVNPNRVVDLLGLTDRIMAGRTKDGRAGKKRGREAYLDAEVHFAIVDRDTASWTRWAEFFTTHGWRHVDGCQNVWVMASPRVDRDATRVWPNKLGERVDTAMSRTEHHHAFHGAVVREMLAGGADEADVEAVLSRIVEAAPERDLEAVQELVCEAGGRKGCVVQRDRCGGSRSTERSLTGHAAVIP